MSVLINSYLENLNRRFRLGNGGTEHTFRGDLQHLDGI